jgi:hypothetical protein
LFSYLFSIFGHFGGVLTGVLGCLGTSEVAVSKTNTSEKDSKIKKHSHKESTTSISRIDSDHEHALTGVTNNGSLNAFEISENQVQTFAKRCDSRLRYLVRYRLKNKKDFDEYTACERDLVILFLSDAEETRVAALEWLCLLHAFIPEQVISSNPSTLPSLLKLLSDPSTKVLHQTLVLLSQILTDPNESNTFIFLIGSLLSLFDTDRNLLEERGLLILKYLTEGGWERVFRGVVTALEKGQEYDWVFKERMVRMSSLSLVSGEGKGIRKILKGLRTPVIYIFNVRRLVIFLMCCINRGVLILLQL